MFKNLKWRTIIGLIIMYVAIWQDWTWLWGVLFLIWVVPDIIRGITYFIEPIDKRENPFLFWLIVVTWFLMAIYNLADLSPKMKAKINLAFYNETTLTAPSIDKNVIDESTTTQVVLSMSNKHKENYKLIPSQSNSNDTLFWSPQNLKSMNLVGVSKEMNLFHSDFNQKVKALWKDFLSLKSAKTKTAYLVYHHYDMNERGQVIITICTPKATKGKNQFTDQLTIPKQDYTSFRFNNDTISPKNVRKYWDYIMNSNFKQTLHTDIEQYKLLNRGKEVFLERILIKK
ncbi:hypothetical protein EMN47_13125 [Prolixibacteraceae bacterium JC049]|nr:hypothetical protein [Prolixibacteraceae bacterium JC049]